MSRLEHLFNGNKVLSLVFLVLALLVSFAFITVEVDLRTQAIIGVSFFLAALFLSRRFFMHKVFLMVMSLNISFRYIYWRGAHTLLFDTTLNTISCLILFLAELYVIVTLLLNYFETLYPLHRSPVPLPPDPETWPTVDVFIPTYNESPDILRKTISGALSIEYPGDKIKIYVLDDGRRAEVKNLAGEAGVFYITREDNIHAKAGNLNNALRQTQGELIAVFDADHIPNRAFLQLTTGFFSDEKMALVQTPHHFYNFDAFEKNLAVGDKVPAEQSLFHDFVQLGKDFWGAAYFSGSCALIRREALLDVGGIATGTVTEDALTSMRLHAKGYKSCYLPIPLAAGIAPARYAHLLTQRIRWTQGMIQIMRKEPPIFNRGLSLPQRICYSNSILSFFSGVSRAIFIIAALIFLLFGIHPLKANPWEVIAYAFPHIALAIITQSVSQNRVRHTFWQEIYESSMCVYMAVVAVTTFFNPGQRKFRVTPKDGNISKRFYDWKPALPNLVLFGLTLSGFAGAWIRWHNQPLIHDTILITVFWNFFNFIILLVTVLVAWERPEETRRIKRQIPVTIETPEEKVYAGETETISEKGVTLVCDEDIPLSSNCILHFYDGSGTFQLECELIKKEGGEKIKIEAEFLNPGQAEKEGISKLIFTGADAWTGAGIKAVLPFVSLLRVMAIPINVLIKSGRRGL
ncbi:MAG: UDP-forming cellulose synthase catalytic subunit [Mangrovibacterium sp.]